jgi:exonuclease SbcD
MRILHTGDWHLGRTLLGTDLLDHQAAFLDFLVDVVATRAIDLVVVAGDVYDRAIPPIQAVQMLSSALVRLSVHAQVVVTPGNHDSAARLGFGAALMNDRVRILADVATLHEPVLLNDEHGQVAVYGLPYLAPDMVRWSLSDDPAAPLVRSHQAVVGAAMNRVRDDLSTRGDVRSIVVAHAFVGGAEPSESEQDIRVGGVDRVAETVFDGVDYVALGHLHGPQRVGASGRIRYAGSPIAFSFGEQHHQKSVAIVDLGATGIATVELVPTPVPRPLTDVRGRLDDIESGVFDSAAASWTRVFVTDDVHPDRMVPRVRAQLPYALSIVHEPSVAVRRSASVVSESSDPVAVSGEFVQYATGAAPTDIEIELLRDAYESALAAATEG